LWDGGVLVLGVIAVVVLVVLVVVTPWNTLLKKLIEALPFKKFPAIENPEMNRPLSERRLLREDNLVLYENSRI